MRKYIVFTVLVTCLMALTMCTIAQETQTFERTSDGNWRAMDYAQILEDTDIMAKIIDRALEKKWPKKYEPSTLFRQSLGCQGVYLKDYGFVFMTNINFPVAKRAEPKQEQPPTNDLWQQTKWELKGTYAARYEIQLEHGVNYNTARVSLLKEELLTLIGEYGTRLRQLNEEESVVVVVRGTSLRSLDEKLEVWFRLDGKAWQSKQKEEVNNADEQDYKMPRIAYQVKEPSDVKVRIFDASGSAVRTIDMGHHDRSDNEINAPLPWDGKDEAGNKVKPGSYDYELKIGNDNDVYGGSFVLRRTRSTATDGPWVVVDAPTIGRAAYERQLLNTLYSPKPAISAGRTTLIVKVSRKDIMSYKDGSLDFEEFAKKAEITQY